MYSQRIEKRNGRVQDNEKMDCLKNIKMLNTKSVWSDGFTFFIQANNLTI